MTAADDAGGGAGSGGPAGSGLGQLGKELGGSEGAGVGGTGGEAPEWAKTYEDADIKAWVTKKGWSGPEEAFRSHMELEKLRGVPASQLVKLAPVDDKEAWHGQDGVFAKLGRPGAPDKYELPEVKLGDQDVSEKIRAAAFEAGLSQAQADRMAKELNGWQASISEQRNLEFGQAQKADMEKLKAEWEANGGAQANFLKATAGAQMLGFDFSTEEGEKHLDALEREIGTYKVLSMLKAVGELRAEHRGGEPPGGEGGGVEPFGMTPEQAQREIKDFEDSNPQIVSAWARGEASADVKKRLDTLYAIAYPGGQM